MSLENAPDEVKLAVDLISAARQPSTVDLDFPGQPLLLVEAGSLRLLALALVDRRWIRLKTYWRG
jgi:hypothetical protein